MKIPGTGPVQTTTARRRTQSTKSAGAFAGQLTVDTGAKEVSPTVDVASINTLLTVQEVGDPTNGRRRAIKRGEDLLDRLDELRHGLLIGAYSPAKLDDLLAVVRQQQANITDPKLREILSDIEVRAAVELAKLGKY
jgi:hypothetical protein